MKPMFLIINLIANLQTTPDLKQKITMCALYGVQYKDKVALMKKYVKCKKEILK